MQVQLFNSRSANLQTN